MDKKKKNIIRKVVTGVALVAIVSILIYIRLCVGSIVAVSGLSMYPTFNNGDFVYGTVVDESTELNKNDIVIVKEDNILLIKRIHGTPNEVIQNADIGIERTELGDNEYYIVGDNYSNSRDSRSFGPVDRSRIVYKYAGIHWTTFTLITTCIIPLVCLFAIFTLILIPGARKERFKYADVIAMTTQDTNDPDNVAKPETTAEDKEAVDITTNE